MREKIETKIAEVIDYIVSKNAENITYNEYRILDCKLSSLKWEEDQEKKNKEMAELFSKTFSNTIGNISPIPLPDIKEG